MQHEKKSETSIDYYSLDKIDETKATYRMVIGQRSNGKSYAALSKCVKNWIDGKGQFVLLRRWAEDIKGSRASGAVSALNSNDYINKVSNGKYNYIHYYAGKYYAANRDEETNKIIFDNISDCIGHLMALNNAEHYKGTSYPQVTTVVFDEFLTKQSELRDEFVQFINVISTIVRRRRNVVIYMLGNTVSRNSEYWIEMGLHGVKEQKQGTVCVYTFGEDKEDKNNVLTVAVEYCARLKSKTNEIKFFAFDNPKLQMITTGSWELNMYPHLEGHSIKPNEVALHFFIEHRGETFHCRLVQTEDGDTFIFAHEKKNKIKDRDDYIIYSRHHTFKANVFPSIRATKLPVQKLILRLYKLDKWFYANNEVGDRITNFIKETL